MERHNHEQKYRARKQKRRFGDHRLGASLILVVLVVLVVLAILVVLVVLVVFVVLVVLEVLVVPAQWH